MIYGVVLAGGIGSRMGGDKPKQFYIVGGKPVIIHTVEKFITVNDFEKVLVLCPEDWVEYTVGLIAKYIPNREKIIVLKGGDTRNETLMNAIKYIDKEGNLDDNTVIVTHDAVRPFVTHRILNENIKAMEVCDACDTVVPATDTIVEALDNEIISNIPDRKFLYQGQTPQTFKALKLKKLYDSLTAEEKDVLTDAAKIFVIKGQQVQLVPGETYNIKITYPYDITVAEALIKTGV